MNAEDYMRSFQLADGPRDRVVLTHAETEMCRILSPCQTECRWFGWDFAEMVEEASRDQCGDTAG